MYSWMQKKKKPGNENFPNVNLVLAICSLIVYLTGIVFYKMSLNVDHNSNLSSRKKFSQHTVADRKK
jgi:predicted membrane channel-forming protein YqfA (hemolysin III family)